MLHEVRVKYSFTHSDNFREKETRHVKEFLYFIILHYTDTWLLIPSPPFSMSAPPLCFPQAAPSPEQGNAFSQVSGVAELWEILFSTDYYSRGACISLWEVLQSREVTGMESSCSPSRPVQHAAKYSEMPVLRAGTAGQGSSWQGGNYCGKSSKAGEQEYHSVKSA